MAGDNFFELGYWLVFAQGLEPVELLARLGCDLVSEEPLSWRDGGLIETEDEDVNAQAVRVGRVEEWAFAVAWYGSIIVDAPTAVRAVSAGTVAVSLERNVNAASWWVVAMDSEVACEFTSPDFHVRSGQVPDMLVDDMMSHGLLHVDGTAPIQHGISLPDIDTRVLRMFEGRFGLALPRELITRGELLTGLLIDD
ncbi:hypothetical protein GCM10022214_76430 [Actinomadura miaoliensis]|uniref:Immunity protein 35 domain-containing protein n=1 Tax=Actinomadura miaoliensis TaxID=430685 RepID=A0ABP7WYB5_9ACTN